MRSRVIARMATVICIAALVTATSRCVSAAETAQKVRVVVTTGGHDFEQKGFREMWNSFSAISCREVPMGAAADAFTTQNLANCDVLVLYDMQQKSTDQQRAAFLDYLKRGGGLVALHHSIASQPDWADYERIIGVKYFLKPTVRDGRQIPQSGYQHDVDFRVHIADPKHPITEGMSDFDIHDETYSGFIVHPKVRVLLTTDHPKSDKTIGWTRREGKARVVYIQLGHDTKAYANPNYRRLVERAVLWAAGRIGKGEKKP